MVTYGDVHPVFQQWGCVGAEHLAKVGRVVTAGIEVGVVPNRGREHHLARLGPLHHLSLQASIVTKGSSVFVEKGLQGLAGVCPGIIAEGHE